MIPTEPPSFFYKAAATTQIYTLSLHDALPISDQPVATDVIRWKGFPLLIAARHPTNKKAIRDRKSTRLNSSHGYISYAVFCLKKKNNTVNLNIPNYSLPLKLGSQNTMQSERPS